MSYKMTAVCAKDEEHMDTLKTLLKTDFGNAIKIIESFDNEPVMSDGRIQRHWNELDTEPMNWGQKRTLRKMGFEVRDMTVHTSM